MPLTFLPRGNLSPVDPGGLHNRHPSLALELPVDHHRTSARRRRRDNRSESTPHLPPLDLCRPRRAAGCRATGGRSCLVGVSMGLSGILAAAVR